MQRLKFEGAEEEETTTTTRKVTIDEIEDWEVISPAEVEQKKIIVIGK